MIFTHFIRPATFNPRPFTRDPRLFTRDTRPATISQTLKYVASGVYKRSSPHFMQAKTDKRNLNHLLIQVILSVVHCASSLLAENETPRRFDSLIVKSLFCY